MTQPDFSKEAEALAFEVGNCASSTEECGSYFEYEPAKGMLQHALIAAYNKGLVDAVKWHPIATMPDDQPCLVTNGSRVAPYSNGYMPWNEGRSFVFLTAPTLWMKFPLPPAKHQTTEG